MTPKAILQLKGLTPARAPAAPPPAGRPWTFMKLSPLSWFFIIANFAFLLFGLYTLYFALQLEPLDDSITHLISFNMSTYKNSLLLTVFGIIFSSMLGMYMGMRGTDHRLLYIIILGFLFFSTLFDLDSSGKPNSLQIGLKSGILKGMQAFNQSNSNNNTQSERAGIAGALQMAQSKFQCCGWHGAQDYRVLNGGNACILPSSCHQNEPVTAFALFNKCNQSAGAFADEQTRGVTKSQRPKRSLFRSIVHSFIFDKPHTRPFTSMVKLNRHEKGRKSWDSTKSEPFGKRRYDNRFKSTSRKRSQMNHLDFEPFTSLKRPKVDPRLPVKPVAMSKRPQVNSFLGFEALTPLKRPKVDSRLPLKPFIIFKGCRFSEIAQLPGKLGNLNNVLLVFSLTLFIVSQNITVY